MSEEEWGRHGLFDNALVRRAADDQMKVEHPPEAALARQTSPPAGQAQQLLVGVHDPRLAAVCFEASTADATAIDAPTDQPKNDEATIAQLGMALYLLQTLHSQDEPGGGHLSRDDEESDEGEGE